MEMSPRRAIINTWFNYFQSGRTSVFVEKSPGRSVKIDEKITESLKEIVKNNRKLTTRELTTRINVSKGTLHTLLTIHGIRKLCSRFVPRFLTVEM